MRRYSVSILALLLSIGCAGADPRAFLLTDEETDVAEAVFRYQLANTYPLEKVYCLSIFDGTQEKNPPDILLKRFLNYPAAIKAGSRCLVAPEEEPYFTRAFRQIKQDLGLSATNQFRVPYAIDAESNKTAMLLRIKQFRKLDGQHYAVDGGYFLTGLSASVNTYTLVKHGGKWSVEKDKRHWIAQKSVKEDMLAITQRASNKVPV